MITLFSSVFIAVGLVVLCFVGSNLILSQKSYQWSSAMGKIENSQVKEVSNPHGGRQYTKKKNSRGVLEPAYSASIDYRFTVNNVQFVGERVDFGLTRKDFYDDANELVSRYPRGADVRVYYDPENPEESVLEPGSTISEWLWLLPGFAFLSFGLVLLNYRNSIRRRELVEKDYFVR